MSADITRRQIGLTMLGATAALALGPICPVRAATEKKIAVLPKTLVNDVFQIKIAEAAEQAAAKLGISTERFASSSDVAVQDQINIVEAVIARGEFGGIVLAATVARGLGNVVRKAKQAGI